MPVTRSSIAKKGPYWLRSAAANADKSRIPRPGLKTIIKKKSVNTGPINTRSQKRNLNDQPTKLHTVKSIFTIPDVMDALIRNGSVQDLYILRQMSHEFYKKMNPIFGDRLHKKIEFNRDSVRVDGEEITRRNWDPDLAHLFRRVKLDPSFSRVSMFSLERLHATIIMSQISSYITKVTIESFDFMKILYSESKTKPMSEKVSEFIGKFRNLKHLKIWYKGHMKFSLSELEMGLRNVNSNVQVRLICNREGEQRKDILNIFGSKPNFIL